MVWKSGALGESLTAVRGLGNHTIHPWGSSLSLMGTAAQSLQRAVAQHIASNETLEKEIKNSYCQNNFPTTIIAPNYIP